VNAIATPSHASSIWSIRATELMTPNPGSLREDASVRDAVRFLTDKGYSAAPVINDAGRPVGVLSRSDILVHDRETAEIEPQLRPPADAARVRDLMSPFVLVVDPNTRADEVAREMVAFRVHRLFVVDGNGVLIGVISALDLLRRLQPVPAAGETPEDSHDD
jgi:CBS domain-containing protein